MTDMILDPSATGVEKGRLAGSTGRFPAWAEVAFEAVLAFVLFVELFILFGNILLRQIFHRSLPWAEEVASLSLVSIAFIGGAIAFYKGEHLSVRFIIDKLPQKWKAFADAFVCWLIVALAGTCLILIFPVLGANWRLLTPALEISKAWIYVPYPIGMCLLVIFAVKRLMSPPPWTAFAACAAAAVLLCVWLLALRVTGPWNGLGGFLFGGATLLAAIALGMPIGFGLPMVAGLFLFSSDLASIDALPMTMSNGVTGFIMLAIPFFVLAGDLMTEGGLTRPLADWVCSLVGHLCGGLAQVLVVSMFIFSGISGSKVADIAAVGTTMRNMLKEQGYDPAESSAILAGSAIMGETIPPSLPLLVVGSITTISVGALFIAGIVPAVLMAVCLMIFIYFKGRTNSWSKGRKATWAERLKVTFRAIPVLFVPLMLVVGIVGGIATPTEVSSFAVVYAVIIALVLYRSVRVRDLVRIFARSAVIAGMILFTISAGAAFSWTMTVGGLPRLVVELLNLLGGSVTVFLIISLVALVILGGVLEGLPALLVTVPLLMPIAVQSGLNPIHYAIVLIFAMGMGCFIPPFGIGFYVSCSIGESSTEKVTPKLVPYVLVLTAGLLLVTFIPWFVLVLPRIFHLTR